MPLSWKSAAAYTVGSLITGDVGDDPFRDILEKTLKGRTEQERLFEIFRADTKARVL